MSGRNRELSQCNRTVRKLCNLAAAGVCQKATCHDHLCHKTTNTSLISGREINLFLQSFETGYGTESRQGITIEPNAVNDDEDYLVCANLKKHIDDITKLDNTECYMNDDDDDDDDNNDNDDDDADDLGQFLLSTLTVTQFTDVRSKLIDVGVNSVPSHFIMTKNRPKMTTLFYGDKNEDKDFDNHRPKA